MRYAIIVILGATFGMLAGATIGALFASSGGIAVGASVGGAGAAWFVGTHPGSRKYIGLRQPSPREDLGPDEGGGALLSDLIETDDILDRLDEVGRKLEALRDRSTQCEG